MSRPWMPLYIADYLKDTTHLGALESGAYLHLIMDYWQNGKVPDDDRQLARIARLTEREWKRCKPILQAFFYDGWKHKRIDTEIAHATDVSTKRAAAVASRGAVKAIKPKINPGPIDPTIDPSIDPPVEGSIDPTIDPPVDPTIDPSNTPSNDHTLHTTQRKKEEDTADAVTPSTVGYAFESGVIKLNQHHFEQWKSAFSYLDLPAELFSLTQWAGEQERQGKSWFHVVCGALAKRNREAKLASERVKSSGGFQWNGIEGVI